MSFPERDWRHLSHLKPLALDRLCQRILDEVQDLIAGAPEEGSHRTYLALWRHLRKRDRLVADGFDDWSRSNGLLHLAVWRRHHLITDEEFAAFTPETRKEVDSLLSKTEG